MVCVLIVGSVGKPAVIQLCHEYELSDHLVPALSHSRLAVLITACFCTFLSIWIGLIRLYQ